MLPDESNISALAIIAASRELLANNGFRIANDLQFDSLPATRALVAEDDYSVVTIVAYETFSELQSEWSSAQADLVTLLARRLARSAPKAWDGYLVLMSVGSSTDRSVISTIERDTTRVRKIVATGEMLRTTRDVARVLDPFLPLTLLEASAELPDVLATLPELLKNEVPVAATEAVIDAFRKLEPPLERIHALGGTS
jgi:hypothetical protein